MNLFVTFLHVGAVFVFLLAHGASANVAFKLRRERNVERIKGLLELSTDSYMVLWISLLVILATGILGGFLGSWWGQGWIWVSLLVLIVMVVLMSVRGSPYYGSVRKAVGLPYMEGRKMMPAVEPRSQEEIDALLKSSRPLEVTAIGVVGLVILLWLMMFKPF